MKRLRVEEVRKENKELEELTDIFIRWGNDLNDGQQVPEMFSAFELGEIAGNGADVVKKISYKDKSIACNSIHDDFSLRRFLRNLIT
ncbi:MAG: hypothetical protein K2N80_01965 [Lachnospiraceae bacterium]|nr:hypothetical protein [Lachnospiraceae bacterium]